MDASNQRDPAQRTGAVILAIVFAASICVLFWLRYAPPRGVHSMWFIERRFPGLISSNVYVQMLHSRSPEQIRSAFYSLTKRRDPAGIPQALVLLESDDSYTWINAADYLGLFKRQESIPYLIKGLRHQASRNNADRAQYLHEMTGQNFGVDFVSWRKWWLSTHQGSAFSWDTHLGRPGP